MLVPTRAPPGFVVSGVGGFDTETCFTSFKVECTQSETPAYWTISYCYVGFLFIAFILNVFVILLYARGIHKFKKMIFYWLTFHLMAANLFFCIGQFINRDTLVIFANASRFDKAFLTGTYSHLHSVSKWIMNFYTQILPLGIISLAFHRFGIFVLTERGIKERHLMLLVTVAIYFLAIPMTVILTVFDCFYHFEAQTNNDTSFGFYYFKCSSSDNASHWHWIQEIYEAEQLIIPCLDLLIYLIIAIRLIVTRGFHLSQRASYFLLFPPFTLFVVASSLTGTFILTTKMGIESALVAKRLINIVDMIAASLVPVIILGTNKEVRQMVYRRKRTVMTRQHFLRPSQNPGSVATL